MKFKKDLMVNCQRCSLRDNRTQVVLPIINDDPVVLFLGEAPGKTEDSQGIPFVGSAGRWHKSVVKFLEISDKFIVDNIVSCRPTRLSESGNIVNGKPTQEQIKACNPWLTTLLLSYDYKLLILYGGYAINRILGVDSPVENNVGRFHTIEVKNKTITSYACYHPATLVYNANRYKPIWRKHLKEIKEYLKEA